MDGSVDAGKKGDELVVLVYCAKDDSTMEITSRTRFWSVCNLDKKQMLLGYWFAFKIL